MTEWFNDLIAEFRLNFIDGDKWTWLFEGLGNTLLITFFAVIMGIVIGIIVATIRSTYDTNKESMKKRGGIRYIVISFFNIICNIYLTVIRGTPVVVQLMISYFIIFSFS